MLGCIPTSSATSLADRQEAAGSILPYGEDTWPNRSRDNYVVKNIKSKNKKINIYLKEQRFRVWIRVENIILDRDMRKRKVDKTWNNIPQTHFFIVWTVWCWTVKMGDFLCHRMKLSESL